MKKLSIFLLNIFIAVNLSAGETGSASMQFLNIAPNARVAAMGDSFTAQADDVSAAYWNPGGLNYLKNMEVGVNYNLYIENISFLNVMFAKNFSFGGLGVNLSALSFGSIDNYVDGELAGTISPTDLLFSVSYSREIMYNLSIGGTFKFMSESLTDEHTGSGIGFDVGLLYNDPLGIFIKKSFVKPLKFGFTVQNIGIGPKYETDNNSLPLSIKFGFAYKYRFAHSVAMLKDINLMLDFVVPNDASFGIRYGTELWWYNLGGMVDAALRFGIKAPQDLGFVSGITAGLGIRIYGIEIDYAVVNMGDLGLTHRIGMDYKFGAIVKPKEVFIKEPAEEKKSVEKEDANKKKEELEKEDELNEDNFEDDSDTEEELDLEE